MISTEPLFLGVTPAGARNYVASQIAALGKPVYNPCAGRFGAIEAAIKAGARPEAIYASDISLFSSLIGYLADPSKRLQDLDIRILDRSLEAHAIADELDYAAHLLLILKLNQIRQRNLRGLYIREELLASWNSKRAKLRADLEVLVNTLRGIHCEIADVWGVVDRLRDQDVAFYASVPHYAGGYTKMFSGSNLSWNTPAIPEFDPKDFPRLLTSLTDAKTSAFLRRRCEWDEEIPAPWTKVYGKPDGKAALWILANESAQARAENKTGFGIVQKFPIYDDHEITPAPKIRVIMVGLPTALYYRDLFVHRLGATTADRGFLLLVDGQVMTAFGFSFSIY